MNPSDDGKVIDGKIVVWLHVPGAQAAGDATAPRPRPPVKLSKPEAAAEKAAAGNAAAASLKAAAATGVPFCEECEAARKAQA
jgi:hypothetical protein